MLARHLGGVFHVPRERCGHLLQWMKKILELLFVFIFSLLKKKVSFTKCHLWIGTGYFLWSLFLYQTVCHAVNQRAFLRGEFCPEYQITGHPLPQPVSALQHRTVVGWMDYTICLWVLTKFTSGDGQEA